MGLDVMVVTGDTESSVRPQLAATPFVNVVAGVSPATRAGSIHQLEENGRRVAVVARAGSPLAAPRGGSTPEFSIDRRAGAVHARLGPSSVRLHGAGLDAVVKALAAIRSWSTLARRHRSLIHVYHFLALPLATVTAALWLDWRLWPVSGIIAASGLAVLSTPGAPRSTAETETKTEQDAAEKP